MREFSIEPATPEDAAYIASNLRKIDLESVYAFGMRNPLTAALYSFDVSRHKWTGKCNGTPVCIFGVSLWSTVLGHGAPWLMGTDKIDDYKIPFLRGSVRMVDKMKAEYPILSNYVYEKNKLSKRWLTWLGFTGGPAVSLGCNGEKFNHFTWRKV